MVVEMIFDNLEKQLNSWEHYWSQLTVNDTNLYLEKTGCVCV